MWTTKKELTRALKLSVEAGGENFPAFVELGPFTRGSKGGAALDEKGPRRAGHGCMRTCCAMYETRYFFTDVCAGRIVVPYSRFKEAVAALDNREAEIVIEHGVMHFWQGRECVRVAEYVFGEEVEKNLPIFPVDEAAPTRWLNACEVAGAAAVIRQIAHVSAEGEDAVLYFENRLTRREGFEELVFCASSPCVVAAGKVSAERLGGLGIYLISANAARKIAQAHKLLCPAGAQVTFAGDVLRFDMGRYELTAKTLTRKFINPEIAAPRGVIGIFEFERAQLLAFVKKAEAAGGRVRFAYGGGVFSAAAGMKYFSVSGRLEAAMREEPDEKDFQFVLDAKNLRLALKKAQAARVRLYYAGLTAPVYITADNIRYAFLQKTPAEGDEDE